MKTKKSIKKFVGKYLLIDFAPCKYEKIEMFKDLQLNIKHRADFTYDKFVSASLDRNGNLPAELS